MTVHRLKTPNGISINTPGGFPSVETWKENGHKIMRYEYSNGLILVISWNGSEANIDSSYSLTNLPDGSLNPIYSLKNPTFKDRHEE